MSQENLVRPGGCEQHPTAGRIGPYCMACTIIPTPPGMDVSELLSREASAAPDRLTVDSINSDQLDALYERLEDAERLKIAHRALKDAVIEAVERAEQAEAERNGAYRERAHLLAWLATLHQDHAVIAPSIDIDDEGWQLLFLTVAGRQLSWHIAPADADLFKHVEHVEWSDPRAAWDGHTTDEKYQRIAELSRR